MTDTMTWRQQAPGPLPADWLKKYHFAVINPESRHLLPDEWPTLPLLPQAFAGNEGLMPVLLEISTLPREEKARLFNMLDEAHQAGEPAPLSVLLAATSDPEQLAQQLCRSQLCSTHNETAWLRLFDARVWIQLPRILPPEKIASLMGPATHWRCCLYGRWLENSSPVVSHQDNRRYHSPETWQALLRIAPLNRVLARKNWLSLQAAQQHSPLLDALLQQAQQRYQLTRMDDLVRYAELGADCGRSFDLHPIIQQALAAHHDIIDALHELTDEQWQTIRTGMNPARPPYPREHT